MSAFIEVDYGHSPQPFSKPWHIHSLTEGSFVFDKDYEVFDALAWGRDSQMFPEERDPARRPLIAPREIPFPQSLAVAWNYFYLVAEPSDLPNRHFWPAHRCVPPRTAEEWARQRGVGTSEVVQWYNCGPQHRTWRVIADPVFYNASWLLLSEFDAALAHHGLRLAELPVVYGIVHHALSQLEARYGAERVRLVLWFS